MVASNEPRRLSSRSLACWVFAALAGLAVLQLPTPFGGDQALFDVGGNALRSGDVMYADWERLGNQLRQATPPYLVIDGFSRLYLEERNPELAVWLDQGYCFPPDAPRDLLARADTADCAAAGGG